MSSFLDEEFAFIEWILVALLPFLAIGIAYKLYNSWFASQKADLQRGLDHRLNSAYLGWRDWMVAHGGVVQPAFCSRAFNAGETCFAYEPEVHSYEPTQPHTAVESDEPIFDTPCGEPVGMGWSILDFFEGIRFVGKGSLFVTNRNLYLTGASGEIKIPLGELRLVATSCSNFLVEASFLDRPLIFTGVNGQMLRDTIYMLMEAA